MVVWQALSATLLDTIKNREVPCELVEEVNAFIDKMKSAEDDEVEANYDEEIDKMSLSLKLTKIWISAKEKAMKVILTFK